MFYLLLEKAETFCELVVVFKKIIFSILLKNISKQEINVILLH